MPPSLRNRLRSSASLTLWLYDDYSLWFVFSAANHTGLLAATNSLTAFIPLRDIVSHDRLEQLLSIFDRETSVPGLSGLQRRQYELQREWLMNGKVPSVELILWSKGLAGLKEGESYAAMLGGIMVSCCAAFQWCASDSRLTRLCSTGPAAAAW